MRLIFNFRHSMPLPSPRSDVRNENQIGRNEMLVIGIEVNTKCFGMREIVIGIIIIICEFIIKLMCAGPDARLHLMGFLSCYLSARKSWIIALCHIWSTCKIEQRIWWNWTFTTFLTTRLVEMVLLSTQPTVVAYRPRINRFLSAILLQCHAMPRNPFPFIIIIFFLFW